MGGMTRWRLVALIAAGAACRERAQEVRSEAELKQTVDQMMPAVERATGLKFRRHPLVLRRSRTQVRDYVIHKFDNDLPPAELAGAQAAYRLFGLIPDTLDLRRTMVDLLTEQIAGYYDPDSNALYLPADIDPVQVRLIISHELVHALQDQYLDLDSLIQLKRQNDRRTAAQSVLEGQATLSQILVLMPEQKLESLPDFWQLRRSLGQQQEQMKIFAQAPLWLRESLLFPYLGGAEFVRWFEREHPGEQPYGKRMPASTEQILHPSRYAKGDAPIELAFAGPPSDTVRYEDDLGEFETRLLFTQFLGDETEAGLLASGWGGDRYRVLGRAADVLVWYTVWDDRIAADRFAKGLERAWRRRTAPRGLPDGRPKGLPDGRPKGLPDGRRRSEIKRLVIDGRPAVRLVDAPAGWRGWKNLPRVGVTARTE
ncbi:MAG: hypothetical protein DMD47_07515 [Gemmatimonadetes bacterium]|nr:MAG: hypothetical protein DMD47_07515 [Gemmatimonadota bacterium]